MIVLDASALVDTVLDQPTAGWVLDGITNEEVCAPAHQPMEVLSALARLVRAIQIELESARDALTEALALPRRFVIPTASHVGSRSRYEIGSTWSTACMSRWPMRVAAPSSPPTAGVPPLMRPARYGPPSPTRLPRRRPGSTPKDPIALAPDATDP
ncbi:MAG: type II toxin-antitoxin system VapC family toxin [Pseudonocardiaceae bacterium]